GEIVKELDGNLWIKSSISGVERTVFYSKAQVASVDRDSEAAGAVDTGAAQKPGDARTSARRPASEPQPRSLSGAKRAAVISLGGGGDKNMVGLYMTAESLRRCIPLLEAEGVDIVVLRINSGGGALIEIQKLSDVIHDEMKPKFTVVTWIEYAISAAAMTAHCVEEHYFMSRGSYGACTGWSGDLQGMKGRDLEEVIYMMEKISAKGGYPKEIMLAMQVTDDLRLGGRSEERRVG